MRSVGHLAFGLDQPSVAKRHVVTAFKLIATGSAVAGIDNANVTSYTAPCTGLGTATSVPIERSLAPSPNSRAGVAFHVVGTNQVLQCQGHQWRACGVVLAPIVLLKANT